MDEKRIQWHLSTPVCRTLRGVKTHLRLISFDDLRLLMTYLNCPLNDLVDKVWSRIKQR